MGHGGGECRLNLKIFELLFKFFFGGEPGGGTDSQGGGGGGLG